MGVPLCKIWQHNLPLREGDSKMEKINGVVFLICSRRINLGQEGRNNFLLIRREGKWLLPGNQCQGSIGSVQEQLAKEYWAIEDLLFVHALSELAIGENPVYAIEAVGGKFNCHKETHVETAVWTDNPCSYLEGFTLKAMEAFLGKNALVGASD